MTNNETRQSESEDILTSSMIKGPMIKWSEIFLLAARQLEISPSAGYVHNAARWVSSLGGDNAEQEQAIIDLALATGLSAHFIETNSHALPDMDPPFILVLDQGPGLVTSVKDREMTVHFVNEGQSFTRNIALSELDMMEKCRIILLDRHEIFRDQRLDRHLEGRTQNWLRDLFFSNWPIIGQLGLGSLFGNLLAIATSLFAMQVWDRVVPSRSLTTLWVLALGVMLAMVLEFCLRMARAAITDYFGKQADLKLSSLFFSHVLHIRNDARPRSPGTLITQLRDLDQLREFFTSTTLGVLIDLPFVFAFIFIIWSLGGILVLAPLCILPFIILPGVIAQFPLKKLAAAGMEDAALRNAILMESIYRAEDIKTLQAEERFRKLWHQVTKNSGEISLKQRKYAAFLLYFSQMMQQFAYVLVIIMGVYGILSGQLSFGAVLACSILTSRMIAPMAQIPAVLGRLQNVAIGKKALDGLLKLPVDREFGKDYYQKSNIAGHYNFSQVTYSYGIGEKPALIVPNLDIQAGDRIAILGKVGAGKSTLLRLLSGLATAEQGQITLDSTPLASIESADIRRHIGIVLQESSLFYGTLRDNLLISNPSSDDEAILAAMKLACADKLLLNQQHGLDLKLRESGLGLSGGQKQAMMLARLYLRQPDIVLLDEPTASLDEASELAVLQNMQQWLGNRTLIVATHRYPVLALVNRIIVLDNGRIVRDGSKEDILKNLTMPQGQEATKPASAHSYHQ